MFEVFNMGIGFCYVVDPADAERTLSILAQHGRVAQVIGTAVAPTRRRSCASPRAHSPASTSASGGMIAPRAAWGDCLSKATRGGQIRSSPLRKDPLF
jgi:hypothetical protein